MPRQAASRTIARPGERLPSTAAVITKPTPGPDASIGWVSLVTPDSLVSSTPSILPVTTWMTGRSGVSR